MLIVFYKTDGEIYRVSTGYKTLEEFFGMRTKEYAQIFDCIYVDFNDFIFRNYFNFKVVDKKIMPNDNIKHMFTIGGGN